MYENCAVSAQWADVRSTLSNPPIGPKERDWENPKALGLLAPSPESEIYCSSFHAAVQQATIPATSQGQFLPGRMAELTSIPVI